MSRSFPAILFLFLLAATWLPAVIAQDSSGDTDGSSQQVESSDDAYRRRMELEDARRKDPTYTDPVDSYKQDQEKIDTLPEESRENIRDQLIDVIVKNGEWEPGDALDEYPYQATEGAEQDPDLKKQEQEAWDEQIEKYHEREAAAFGAHRGPVPGPGNPTGQEGGQQSQGGGQQGQQGQDGQGGGGQQTDDEGGSSGTYEYQPGSSNSSDEVSTAGVSESALDFLKDRQAASGQSGGAPQSPPQGADEQESTEGARQSAAQWAQQQAQNEPAEAAEQQEQAQQQAQNEQIEAAEQQELQEQQDQVAQSESQSQQQDSENQESESSIQAELDQRGIIAIKDLDKLEGTESPPTEDGNR